MRLHTSPTAVRICSMASTVSYRSPLCCPLASTIRRNFGQLLTWPVSGFANRKPRRQRAGSALVSKLFTFIAVMSSLLLICFGPNCVCSLLQVVATVKGQVFVELDELQHGDTRSGRRIFWLLFGSVQLATYTALRHRSFYYAAALFTLLCKCFRMSVKCAGFLK